jgi:hypothetical protein
MIRYGRTVAIQKFIRRKLSLAGYELRSGSDK